MYNNDYGRKMKRLVFPILILLIVITACIPLPKTTTVSVYFQDMNRFAIGTEPYEKPVTRRVPDIGDLPLAVLEQLFLGPTAEEQAEGLALILSGSTGFNDFHVQAGVARISLTGHCNSNGSTYTIANLIFANLTQFPEIQFVKIYDENGETETPVGLSSSIPFCLEP
jgi:hypothetical protein